MSRDERLCLCTVVYYDGVQAYTTHRALWIDCTGKYKLTAKSAKALKKDMEAGGMELLKVDFNLQWFMSAFEFMNEVNEDSFYTNIEKYEIDHVKAKYLEYFTA